MKLFAKRSEPVQVSRLPADDALNLSDASASELAIACAQIAGQHYVSGSDADWLLEAARRLIQIANTPTNPIKEQGE